MGNDILQIVISNKW